MESVVPSAINEFAKPMHELSNLRERISRYGIISPAFKPLCSLPFWNEHENTMKNNFAVSMLLNLRIRSTLGLC